MRKVSAQPLFLSPCSGHPVLCHQPGRSEEGAQGRARHPGVRWEV